MAERASFVPVAVGDWGDLNRQLVALSDAVVRAQRLRARAIASDTTLTDYDDIVVCDTSGGSITITLPPARTRALPYYVIKADAANTVTLDGDGSETINGAATYAFTTLDQCVSLVGLDTARTGAIPAPPAVWGWRVLA